MWTSSSIRAATPRSGPSRCRQLRRFFFERVRYMSEKTQTEKNGDIKIGELPELHIVALNDVVLHEDPDMERVARLVDRFSADRILKNPPIVGRSKGHRLIVLDGANRVTALRKLGYSHVLVQELDLFDPGLSLGTWHHAIERLSAEELLDHAASIPGGKGYPTAQPDEGLSSVRLLRPGQLYQLGRPDPELQEFYRPPYFPPVHPGGPAGAHPLGQAGAQRSDPNPPSETGTTFQHPAGDAPCRTLCG